jgi:hypothetical protein
MSNARFMDIEPQYKVTRARRSVRGGGKDDMQGVSVSLKSADGMLSIFVARACKRIHAIRDETRAWYCGCYPIPSSWRVSSEM